MNLAQSHLTTVKIPIYNFETNKPIPQNGDRTTTALFSVVNKLAIDVLLGTPRRANTCVPTGETGVSSGDANPVTIVEPESTPADVVLNYKDLTGDGKTFYKTTDATKKGVRLSTILEVAAE